MPKFEIGKLHSVVAYVEDKDTDKSTVAEFTVFQYRDVSTDDYQTGLENYGILVEEIRGQGVGLPTSIPRNGAIHSGTHGNGVFGRFLPDDATTGQTDESGVPLNAPPITFGPQIRKTVGGGRCPTTCWQRPNWAATWPA